ncbi:DnaB-like helicase C-terminal domain-containing protein [Salinifilum ghardaiensis]
MTSVNDTTPEPADTLADELPPLDQAVETDAAQAEQYLIGYGLARPGGLSNTVLSLPPEHFSSDGHAALWSLAVERATAGDQHGDLITLQRTLHDRHPELPGAADRAQQYMLNYGFAAGVAATNESLAEEVTRGHATRQTRQVLVRAWQALNSGHSSTAREIMTTVDPDVGMRDSWRTLGSLWEQALTEAENPAATIPLPWPTVTNYFTGGMRSGRMYALMGATGTGKTAAAQQIADCAAKNGRTVAAFSLEMEGTDLARRQMSTSAGVSMSETMRPGLDLTADSLSQIDTARAQIAEKIIVDSTQELTGSEIRSRARVAVRRHGAELLIVDYGQLVEHENPRLSEYERIGETIKTLTGMSRELRVPVVVLVQPNRNAQVSGRRLELFDAHGSSAIEKYSAGALVLNTVYEDDEDGTRAPTGMVDIDIAKNRYGQANMTVRTVADLSHQRFEELSK